MTDLDELRYPVGQFNPRPTLSHAERAELVEEIAHFPAQFRDLVEDLLEATLDTQYRPGGWTVRQVVHHVPDSHMQGYVRFKLAMTENNPTIRTYDQGAWGETSDARTAPIEFSLDLLDALHERWVFLLNSLKDSDFSRTYRHPEMGDVSLDTTIQLYAWHGRHHTGHVRLVVGTT